MGGVDFGFFDGGADMIGGVYREAVAEGGFTGGGDERF